MLAALGDLVEDVVVTQREPASHASDTASDITRRQGGSAANVALVAARRGNPARFIGQVGDDDVGRRLVEGLTREGVDTGTVHFSGSTGTIVVLVDERGERTMYTDRRACVSLVDPERGWLDGVDILHVPFYSLTAAPISETAETMIGWAHSRGISVSIDLSSEAVLMSYGPTAAHLLLERLAPDALFANENEARALDVDSAVAGAVTVVKQGGSAAVVHAPDGSSNRVEAQRIDDVRDTTGAGDAFAAGFLTWRGGATSHASGKSGPVWKHDLAGACAAGHSAAAALITER